VAKSYEVDSNSVIMLHEKWLLTPKYEFKSEQSITQVATVYATIPFLGQRRTCRGSGGMRRRRECR